MKKLLIVSVLLLLLLSVVFGLINAPIQRSPSITKSFTLITKMCNSGALRCFNNKLQICLNNAWTVKEQCTSAQYCNQLKGCISKNIIQQLTTGIQTIKDSAKTKIPDQIRFERVKKIKGQDLTKIRGKLPKAPTHVNCEEFREKEIIFPEKNYEGFNDCQLLQNRALIDEYIKRIRETARECYEFVRKNLESFNERINHLIQEINNANEINGRGITESADLLMRNELFDKGFDSLIKPDKNEQNKIKNALDALTSQVKNLCDSANRINSNVFKICQDINKRLSSGLDRHEPGLTKEEKKGFIEVLNGQESLANTNSNIARNNYKQVYVKDSLDDMIYVKGVENACKQGASSGYYSGYISEAEKRRKWILSIKKETVKFRKIK